MFVQDLRDLIAAAQKRASELEEEERQAAINRIKELAASAGLKVKIDGEKKGRPLGASGSKQPQKAGLRYLHPDDPKKVYVVGRGRKPRWVEELEQKGIEPSPAKED